VFEADTIYVRIVLIFKLLPYRQHLISTSCSRKRAFIVPCDQ